MSDQELKSLPKGFLKTVAYTQLCAAIKNDFDIELPMKSGKETTRAIEGMLGLRTPDPMLEALAVALEKACDSVCELIDNSCGVEGLHMSGDVAPWHDLRSGGRYEGWLVEFDEALELLQKYQQSKVQP